MGRMFMRELLMANRMKVLVNHILPLGVLFSISYVELKLNLMHLFGLNR